LVRVVSETAVF